MKRIPLAAIVAILVASGGPVRAVTWEVDAFGRLTGASGVDIDGTLHDVHFAYHTCAALFTGCDDPADFLFQDKVAALAASQALQDQVLLDVAAGAFDSDPGLVVGCEFGPSESCHIFTPYFLGPTTEHSSVAVHNGSPADFDSIEPNDSPVSPDFVASHAIWQISTPEPSASWLAGACLLLMGWRRTGGRIGS